MWWVYRTELRRSALRWVLPVFVGLDLLVLFGRSRSWIGVWSQTSAAAQIPAFYLGPALAGAAVWAVAARRRTGVFDQFPAARSARRAEAAHLAATMTYGLAAYAVGVVVAAVASARQAGPDFRWPGYVLLGLALMVLCAGLGHLVGRLTRSMFAAPVLCALGCLVLLGLFGFVPEGTSGGLGLAVVTGYPNRVVEAWPLVGRLAVAAATVALAVYAGPRLRPGWRGRPTAPLGAVSALVLTAVLCVSAGPLLSQRPPVEAPLCTEGRPKICSWPESRKYLPEFRAMAARTAALPAGLVTSPEAFYEDGLRGEPADAGEGFYLREGETWELATFMAIRIVEATIPQQCRAAAPGQFELIAWLTARIAGHGQPASVHGGPPGVDPDAIGRLAAEPEQVQEAWARARLPRSDGAGCA